MHSFTQKRLTCDIVFQYKTLEKLACFILLSSWKAQVFWGFCPDVVLGGLSREHLGVDVPCSEGGLSPTPGGSAEKVIPGLPSLLSVSPGWKRGSSAPPTQLCWALTRTCRLPLVSLVVGGTGWGLGERLTQKLCRSSLEDQSLGPGCPASGHHLSDVTCCDSDDP